MRMCRKFIAGFALLAGLSSIEAAVAQDVKLVAAHTGAPGTSVYVFFDTFAKEVEALSNGAVTVDVHPAGELGGDKELIEQIRIGTIDMGSAATSNMGGFTTAYLWTDLPYVFNSRESAAAVMADAGIAEVLAGQVEADAGTRVLGYIEVGGFRMLQNRARQLKVPADAVGLKFRVTASAVDVALIKAWGGLPTPVAWSETFTAVQQGVVDGLNLQPLWTEVNGFGEVIKYAVRNKAVMAFHVAQMGLNRWNSLADEQKVWVEAAIMKAVEAASISDKQSEKDYIEKLKQQGVHIYEPTEAEITLWREPALALWDEFKDKVNPELLDQVMAIQATK